MPTYEYQCGACGHQMEAFQKMTDAPLVECPNCHQSTLNKLISASGFQLKGTGWYVTDYKDKSKAKPINKAEGNTDSSSGSKETTSTDSKTSDSKSGGSSSGSTAAK